MKGKTKLYLIDARLRPLLFYSIRKVFARETNLYGYASMFLALLLVMPFTPNAQLQVARIFSDNMVLQRERPVHIWGTGIPGKHVVVLFANSTKVSAVNADSTWSVYFKEQKANTTPQSISVTCDEQAIVLANILIGDIWICSGQSNMEWPMWREKHFKDESTNTSQPLIRLYNPPPAGRYVYGTVYTDSLYRRLNTNDFYQPVDWQQCDSNTVRSMSAVGYYFARSIVASEKVPVGLINLSIGGAPIETFISRSALQKSKRFASKLKGDWLENKSLPLWIRERAKQNVGANTTAYRDALGLNHAYKPGFAFESGIAPILPMPVKGVLWYQGESNSLEWERVIEYRELLHLLIDDYRASWKDPDLPFYWVQLSSIDTINYKSRYWPRFRDEQRVLLSEVKNGGMAVCSDIGFKNDVHPTNKKDVGERLARWALNKTYKRKIIPSGPLPLQAIYTSGGVVISFEYTAGQLQTSDGLPVRGFSMDGNTDLHAMIRGNKILLPVKDKPAFIYYGWKPFTDANLVNSELLPASTFRLKVE